MRYLAYGAILLLLLTSCGERASTSGRDESATQSRTVIATIGMIGDVAREIAGDHTTVELLMGPGVDPHLYKPTRSDVARVMAADLVLYNGLLLEGKLISTLEQASASGKEVLAVTSVLNTNDLLEPEEFEGHYDPHVWMDPTAWANCVLELGYRFMEYSPDDAEVIRSRTNAYLQQLDALNAYCDRVLESVPEQQRVLITAHDAFNYFGRRFGYEVVGIQGLSTESEAGVRDIERIVDLLVERKIRAVFVESTVSERNIRALISGAKARGHDVVVGGELFSDAMGEDGTYEGTYIGMIDHNVTAIARALGGEAPPLGMNGKLSQ